jgi:hypothetical protein
LSSLTQHRGILLQLVCAGGRCGRQYRLQVHCKQWRLLLRQYTMVGHTGMPYQLERLAEPGWQCSLIATRSYPDELVLLR